MIVTTGGTESPQPVVRWWASSTGANQIPTLTPLQFTGTFTWTGHRMDCRCETCRPDIHINATNYQRFDWRQAS
jgi:hypothetical protein